MLIYVAAAWAAPCLDAGEIEALRVEIDFVRSSYTERWRLGWEEGSCEPPEEAPAALPGARLETVASPDEGRSAVEIVRRRVLTGSGSGTLEPWRARADRTSVRFIAPPSVPLQVYTDDRAHRYARDDELLVWWDKGTENPPILVWSSWADWVEAGTRLERAVLRRLPAADELGTLGRSLRGAELSTLVDRLDTTVELIDEEPAGWGPARPIDEVLATGRGTPTERGLLLLAMLRAAGFDARPAWFSPDDNPSLPRTLPAPHLLRHPAIGVRSGKEMFYLDPGTSGARPPEVPARIRGGRILVAGRHLTVPVDTGAPRGEVRVEAELEVERSGQIRVVARLRAEGAAEQVLRSRLTGLGAEQWHEEVAGWVTPRGRELRDLVVDVKGLDGLEPFRIVLRYTEPEKLRGAGSALSGPIRDLMAPWLAGALPPGIAIEERLHIVPPEGSMALTAIRPQDVQADPVLINRTLTSEGAALWVSSDWRVLNGHSSAEALEAVPTDTEVLLFPADASARRDVRRLALPEADRAVIEALLLWRLDQGEKARRMLRRLHRKKLSVAELAALIARYVAPGERRPWQTLVALLEDDAERIAVIDDLVKTGDRRLAWQLATVLATNSPDPLTRARALVQVARFQGPEQPDGQADPEGHRAWRDPIKLLKKASQLAGDHQELVRVELARAYLRRGTPMEAQDLLERAMEEGPTPLAKAVRAEFGAMTGVYGIDVLGLVEEALEEAPFDPDVREATGRALAFLGFRRRGVADILLAAEFAGNDSTRWLTAARFAADFGDLRAAVFAARRASDLEPKGLVQGVRLQLLAKLARDEDALELAVQRSGGTALYDAVPNDLESLIRLAEEQVPREVPDEEGPHPWKLALLRHHVGDVESDRDLLLERALLHHERGMTEDAAQDGSVLLDRHGAAEGARFLLAGVTSRFRHAAPERLIRRYLRSPHVKAAKVELDLVLGARPTPAGDRERQKILRNMRSNPGRVALDAPLWPVGMKDFDYPAPAGFEPNRYLSAIAGVRAWSDPVRQMTVLVTERSTGEPPPPLANLYRTGPTVLSTRRGVTVIRLDGGAIPIFAGVTIADGRDVWGLGLSPIAARDAVLYGTGDLRPPEPD